MASSEYATRTSVVEKALRCFTVAHQAESSQRDREQEALAFQVPEKQWPDDVRQSRESATINQIPIPARPMIAIPLLDQPIQLVLNQERAAQLGVQIHPLDEDASDDTAEVLQGLYRRIEVDSRATLARSWAFERAVKAGRGFYRILTDYDPTAGNDQDQRILIKRIVHQESVYFDPFAQEPDKSDAQWCLIIEDVPWTKYVRLYGKKGDRETALMSFDAAQFEALGSEQEGWIGGDEESRVVRVAEYFEVKESNGERTVTWWKVNAVEVLDTEEWPGQWIPVVPVLGRELIPFGTGERRYVGIIEPNMQAQRVANYAVSGMVEAAALEPRAPFDLDPEEIEGFESFWQQANMRNFPYLPRHKFKGQKEFGPIQRLQADTSKLQINAMLYQNAKDFVHAGTGAFEPTLGDKSPNVRTKGQTLALQQQHEESNSNWLDNLSEISMTCESRIILDLIPSIYDRPGRIARLLDKENKSKTVMLNQPYVLNPQTKRPTPVQTQPGQPLPDGAKHYDLAKGRYGVVAEVGKGYKSRLQAGQDQLAQIFQAEPSTFPLLGDLWFKYADFPGHDEAADRMHEMLPPQIQGEDDPTSATQQVGQLKAQLQQMQAQLQQAGQIIQTKQVEQQAKIAAAKIQSSADVQKAQMDNATKIAVARINAAKETFNQQAEAQEERLATGLQIQADAIEGAKDRTHELNLAVTQHQQALEQAAQAHYQAMQQAEQGAQLGSAQSDQDHSEAMQQGAQGVVGQLAVGQQAAQNQPTDQGAGA